MLVGMWFEVGGTLPSSSLASHRPRKAICVAFVFRVAFAGLAVRLRLGQGWVRCYRGRSRIGEQHYLLERERKRGLSRDPSPRSTGRTLLGRPADCYRSRHEPDRRYSRPPPFHDAKASRLYVLPFSAATRAPQAAAATSSCALCARMCDTDSRPAACVRRSSQANC
jgi:hypothetical protein